MENIRYTDTIIRTNARLIVTYDKEDTVLCIADVDPLLKSVATRVATELFNLSVSESDKNITIKGFSCWEFDRYLNFVRQTILELKANKELSLNKIEIIQRVIV